MWPFLCATGFEEVTAALPILGARRYDPSGLLAVTVLAFALGASSIEGARHLDPVELGALAGLGSSPGLRTWRPRLGALAEACDPLALQRSFAKAMLASDGDGAPQVFFCDDHFVAYTGARRVAKGYNTRRRLAEPGRDDTFICDRAWRAICFDSGEPTGLSVNLPPIVDQLVEICDSRKILIGFDRGGSYPKVFKALTERGVGFVTYRRGSPVTAKVDPRRSWVNVAGRRVAYQLCDETIDLDGYGPCRQLSVIEHGKVVFQVLTSDTTSTAAWLAHTLRCRWTIENAFKYLEDHNNIAALCDNTMDIVADDRPVTNPARTAARDQVLAAETVLADAERALAQALTDPANTVQQKNDALPGLEHNIENAHAELHADRDNLKTIPAKIRATELDPDAKRALPRFARRSLQMVCRLLAYNAELDLARALNAYLQDPDEYRATARHLLHQPGHINYHDHHITVTLQPAPQPRTTRALELLLDQLNTNPPHLPGDHRPITYKIDPRN